MLALVFSSFSFPLSDLLLPPMVRNFSRIFLTGSSSLKVIKTEPRLLLDSGSNENSMASISPNLQKYSLLFSVDSGFRPPQRFSSQDPSSQLWPFWGSGYQRTIFPRPPRSCRRSSGQSGRPSSSPPSGTASCGLSAGPVISMGCSPSSAS